MTTFARAPETPAHVPGDRVVEFDIYNLDMSDGNYQEAVKRLHDQNAPEMAWTPCNGGHWLATRAGVMDRITADPGRFSSKMVSVPIERNPDPPMVPIQMDPPDVGKYRALITPYLAPKAVAVLAEQARTLAVDLIEELRPRGGCEFVSQFAHHMPIFLFMKMADLPSRDRHQLTGYASHFVRPPSMEARTAAYKGFADYAAARIAERRGGTGADIITGLANARADGQPIEERTLLGMIILTMSAGLDTVASMLGFFTRFLAVNVEHRRQLIDDPSLIPNAVEEMLRRFPIVNLARIVAEDTELGGVKMHAGDMVAWPTALYGLDETRFPDPLLVDFKRKRPMHQTFGDGQHRCLGSMLARSELRIFLEEWLTRIPEFHLKSGVDTEVSIGTVTTMTELHLEWPVA